MLSSFTQPNDIPNLYDILFEAEYKVIAFFPYNESRWWPSFISFNTKKVLIWLLRFFYVFSEALQWLCERNMLKLYLRAMTEDDRFSENLPDSYTKLSYDFIRLEVQCMSCKGYFYDT